jgi:O-antigen/teichoic acid export membrane protein
MKTLVQRMFILSNREKLIEWGRLISITGSAQLLIQIIGFTCGILVIRVLSTQEYALYTLANTMLGTMLILADGGISIGVMSEGRKVWQDPKKLGVVLITGFDIRKKYTTISLLIAIPLLIYLLLQHGANWFISILIILSLIPAFFSALSGNVLTIGPALHQTIAPLQKVQLGVNLGRLIMLFLTILVFPWVFIAILSSSLPQIWGNIQLRKISKGFVDWKQKPDPIIRKEILSVVKRILPGSIYYCLSGQITIWLISIFGNTNAVAQIGALGRLSMMLTLFSSIFCTLILPRFARLENNKRLLFKRFFQILIGLLVMFICIVLIVSIFPGQLLMILGKNYSGLEKELILSIAGSCISLFAGLLFTISTSRNWIINPFVFIPLTLVTIICGISLINLTSLAGVLKFNLFVSSTELLIYFIYGILKINKIQ